MKLPSRDSATGRGIATAVQAIIGFVIGLIAVVWAVPGVPNAVLNYVQGNFFQILLFVGIPSGITSLIWNLLRPNIKNY